LLCVLCVLSSPACSSVVQVAAIDAFLEECYASVSQTPAGPLPGDEIPARADVLVWVICSLALHHSLLHRYSKALELIDRGIVYAPTAIQLYSARAKILKRAGHMGAAAVYADWARRLDEADRGLNTTSTRYWLRADQYDRGMRVGSMFIQDGYVFACRVLFCVCVCVCICCVFLPRIILLSLSCTCYVLLRLFP
jgi:N-terminal acetyltransferase A, auxiliary subunit